ncbi:MAG: sulfurtransferase TusA family protein [Candidatus Methanoperedens sp.]|nr:sulfurtransferase TusA family protein [Candidatus Methanoperedens sp.]
MQDMMNMAIELDLRGEVCPYTFVKTKLKLEELDSGEELFVTFDHAPAVENVPRSLKNEGHKIMGIEQKGDKLWKVRIRKA